MESISQPPLLIPASDAISTKPPQSSSPGEIKALTGVRAFAAWWVLLYHLAGPISRLFPGTLLRLSLNVGYLGVDLFFILSGFILSYNYLNRFATFEWATFRRFLELRFARIYPVHLFNLLLILGFVGISVQMKRPINNPELFTCPLFFRNLFLIQAWDFPNGFSWNAPAWSISVEWIAYLLFPLIAIGLSRLKGLNSHILFMIGLLLLLIPALVCIVFRISGSSECGVPRVISEFVSGCILFRCFEKGVFRNLWWSVLVVGFLAACWGISTWLNSQKQLAFFAVPFLGVFLYGLACSSGPAGKVAGAFTFWGRVSFSLYMVQLPVLIFLHQLIPMEHFVSAPLLDRFGILGLYLGSMTIASILCFWFVEEPSRRLIRTLCKR